MAWCRAGGEIERAKITELYVTEALDRVDAAEAGPGEIIAVAGIAEVRIGETLADPDDPRPLPTITIDEPSLSMTVGLNTSPLSGREGDKVTASLIESRLRQELVGNVSLRVLPTERPDTWEVQGRGELQLEVLVEQMRREGFELTVGKPRVVTRRIDGAVHEPMERVSIDLPEEYVGIVTQLFALRKGRTESLVNHGTGWVRMEVLVPARGLIGFRTEFLTETRGTGILHHVFEGFEPWHGELRTRPTGVLIADRSGKTNSFALLNLQERGSMFVGPGTDVYEGMIVGENARAEDLDVNATKEKKLTNMRSSTADELVRLIPPRRAAARPGARVHPRGRVRRGDARERPAAQGGALRPEAAVGREPQGARARLSPVADVPFSTASRETSQLAMLRCSLRACGIRRGRRRPSGSRASRRRARRRGCARRDGRRRADGSRRGRARPGPDGPRRRPRPRCRCASAPRRRASAPPARRPSGPPSCRSSARGAPGRRRQGGRAGPRGSRPSRARGRGRWSTRRQSSRRRRRARPRGPAPGRGRVRSAAYSSGPGCGPSAFESVSPWRTSRMVVSATRYRSGMDLGLHDSVCVVTGSTAGIGLEVARQLAAEGALVAVCGRDRERTQQARESTGAALAVVADLAEPGAPEHVVRHTADALGGIDVLVNNVGVARQVGFDELSD